MCQPAPLPPGRRLEPALDFRETGAVRSTFLPVWQLQQDILDAVRNHGRLVLVAPTGSGKTTQVPQMILDSGLAGAKRIVVLQPRRVAARTVAARVAWERGTPLGQEVGYQVRFDDQTSLGTRICFVTEGILLRWQQGDPLLADVSTIVFDEFHERNLLSDVALALAKRLQRQDRPDLRLVVMSATLEAEPVAEYLSKAPEAQPGPAQFKTPVLHSEGISHPVEVRYLEQHDERPAHEQACDVIEQVINAGKPGDILVFMPGMGEINATIGAVRSIRAGERLALIPLHGDLPPEEQDLAFAPNPLRKVVVATNVAETSVTIDGIRHVVDSGLARVARYDAERGIGTLFIEPISRASADQRKGRAGRTGPGICHRLWTESGQLNRPERNTPEIQRSDLAEVVLLLHSLGVREAATFDWLDKPDPQAVERAEKLLQTLGALKPSAPPDEKRRRGDLTPIGERMLHLPMHPRYSRMLVEAARYDCVPSAALCAALVSGRDLMVRLGRDDAHVKEARELFEASQESDFHTLMRAYQFAKKNGFGVESCRRHGIHAQTARQVDQTFEQILQLARNLVPDSPLPAAPVPAGQDPLLRCLMTGFIDQLCRRRSSGTLECDLAEGRQGTLLRESVVQSADLFVAGTIREVPGRGSEPLVLLGLASAVQREWIEASFPEQVTSHVEHLYDRTHKRVAAVKIVRFQDLVIHHQHQSEVDPAEAGRCLAQAYLQGYYELPLFKHELKQFVARVNLLNLAMPELELPRFDEAAIQRCLARAFAGLTLAKEAQATPLQDAFRAHLPREQLPWIDEMAPLVVPWPDGRKLKLLYPESAGENDGSANPPELQLKLHECFGMQHHPKICEGRLPVRLWLCAPDGKRLEATSDWPAFKKISYPKLKPNLQRKYPGVSWL
jgi:ATP-dependent helicase HrpB